MEPAALACLVTAGAAALLDWWAVAGGPRRRSVERWAKPLTMMLLVGVAATAGSPAGGVRAALVVGAVLGLVGDVALLGDTEVRFMAGLGAFAVGHLAYVAAAGQVGGSAWALVGVGVMGVLLGCRFLTRIVPGARRLGGPVLAGAVLVYGAVISAMVITAWGVADRGGVAWLAGLGASSFALSDWVLGHQRFAGPLPGGRLAVMVPYHIGQSLLLVGLALA